MLGFFWTGFRKCSLVLGYLRVFCGYFGGIFWCILGHLCSYEVFLQYFESVWGIWIFENTLGYLGGYLVVFWGI